MYTIYIYTHIMYDRVDWTIINTIMDDVSVGDGRMRSEPHDQTSGQGATATGNHVRTHGDHSSDRAKSPGIMP